MYSQASSGYHPEQTSESVVQCLLFARLPSGQATSKCDQHVALRRKEKTKKGMFKQQKSMIKLLEVKIYVCKCLFQGLEDFTKLHQIFILLFFIYGSGWC